MSAPTVPQSAGAASATHPALPAVPLTTLVQVELRKMVDTRAGRWLLGIAALITLGVLLIVVFAGGGASDGETLTYGDLLALSQLPASFLLPVLGILAATAEFSQRTALATFSLVPSRGRVLGGKLAAGVLLALASIVVSLIASALALLLAGTVASYDTSWSSASLSSILELSLFQILSVQLGIAFGLAVLNSPVAIVAWFLLPQIWAGLTVTIDALADARPWLDTSVSWTALIDPTAEPMTGELWQQVAVTSILWIGVPLAIGLARVLRKDIS